MDSQNALGPKGLDMHMCHVCSCDFFGYNRDNSVYGLENVFNSSNVSEGVDHRFGFQGTNPYAS